MRWFGEIANEAGYASILQNLSVSLVLWKRERSVPNCGFLLPIARVISGTIYFH